jgi:hypothetical protein
MSYEESYAKAFPFDKMVPGMLDPEVIEDPVKIVNEAIKDKVKVNLIINNRAGGSAPRIAQAIADRLHFFPSNRPNPSMKVGEAIVRQGSRGVVG